MNNKTLKIISELKEKISLKELKLKIKPKFTINKLNSVKIIDKVNPTKLINKAQDYIQNIGTTEKTNQVFLNQSKFWARTISWVLMSGTGFGIIWLSIAKTDEIVITTGRLEPKGGVIEVQMPLEGIAREILIKDGDNVKKGEVLIRLDTELTRAKRNALKQNLESNKIILEKLRILVDEGGVSELQFLEQKTRVINLESDLKANSIQMKYQEIRSPIDGVVFELQPKSSGYVARSTEPVLKIVPNNQLLAKIEIANQSIGFVKPGKHVDISIDSFPASDFGVVEGTVAKIGSDALPPNPSLGLGYRFPADIVLKEQYLKLKSGKMLKLHAGMSLTANIKLRKVTYLQLFLNTFRDKADSLKAI